MKEVTILVNARNEEEGIAKCLDSLLEQDYEKKRYDILVIDDASSDGTGKITKAYASKNRNVICRRMEKRQGRVKCINIALGMIKTPYFIEFNADSFAERRWLKKLMDGFSGEDVGIVKASSMGEGISTAFRTDLVRKSGGVDERYNEMGASLRYDTDMVFSVKEMGYRIVFVKALYGHSQKKPAALRQKVRYALYRISVHKFDVLLYKRHPRLAKDFLGVRCGFFRNPMDDFRNASGLWTGQKKMRLSSPQGIAIIEEKTPLHYMAIVMLSIAYALSVKFARLYGSLLYGKLLI
jgi:cellulose synthase/poly-beta-1,6-N-acetylglucosamine synthase-like glycosyltransferase